MDKQDSVTFLTGWLKGLAMRHDIKVDPIAIDCLRTLGAREVHLELLEKHVEPVASAQEREK